MKIEQIDINKIKINPNNPRLIKDEKYKKLVQSIKQFPQMLEIRPIVINDEMVIIGGNMRYRAALEAGYKKIPIIKAQNLSEEQQKEFIVKDNASFGEWDFELLANEWENDLLNDWGIDIPKINSDVDFSDKNKEIDIDDEESEMVIKLNYTEDDYWKVKEQLSKIAETPEQAVWKLLGNE